MQRTLSRVFILFLFTLFFLVPYPEAAVDKKSHAETEDWIECGDHQIGFQFLCQSNWVIQPAEDAFFVIISSQPSVSITVSKTASRLIYISQLTNEMLEEMGWYEEGFKTEPTRMANQEALLVKAFSKSNDTRQQDYFFLKEGNLYGIFVSVKPADQWEEYKFVLKKVVDSFHLSP